MVNRRCKCFVRFISGVDNALSSALSLYGSEDDVERVLSLLGKSYTLTAVNIKAADEEKES